MSRLSVILRRLARPRGKGALHSEAPVDFGSAAFYHGCFIGAYTYFDSGGIPSSVSHADIGRYCSFAQGVVIGAAPHRIDRLSTHPNVGGAYGEPPKTILGHDVWVGTNAIIVAGVTIGHGAVIGAGAVVTRDVAPYSIVGGVPARLIRMRFTPEMVRSLMEAEWWRYDVAQLGGDIEATIAAIRANSLPRLPETVFLKRRD